jgi:hypothetical protein
MRCPPVHTEMGLTVKTCTLTDCNRPHRAGGYCAKHYMRLLRIGSLLIPRKDGQPRATCAVAGCGTPVYAKGYCDPHYYRWRVYGNPEEPSHAPDWDAPPTDHTTITAQDMDRIFYRKMQTGPLTATVARNIATHEAWEAAARERDARDAQLYPHLFEPVTPSQSIGILSDRADAA